MDGEPSDEDLVREAVEGRRDAFGVLVARYRGLAFRLCARMVGDHHAAEDLSQEAFLRAHRSLSSFRGEALFRTWFLRIVANLCSTWRKSVSRHPVTTGELPDRVAPAEAPAGLSEDFQHRLEEGIRRLPDRQRLTLILRVQEQYDFQRIADILETTPTAVRMQLSLARKALRAMIAPDLSESTP